MHNVLAVQVFDGVGHLLAHGDLAGNINAGLAAGSSSADAQEMVQCPALAKLQCHKHGIAWCGGDWEKRREQGWQRKGHGKSMNTYLPGETDASHCQDANVIAVLQSYSILHKALHVLGWQVLARHGHIDRLAHADRATRHLILKQRIGLLRIGMQSITKGGGEWAVDEEQAGEAQVGPQGSGQG